MLKFGAVLSICMSLFFSQLSSALAETKSGGFEVSHVEDVPVSILISDKRMMSFVTGVLFLVYDMRLENPRKYSDWNRLFFISSPDALVDDHLNVSYLKMFSDEQKEYLTRGTSNETGCYIQKIPQEPAANTFYFAGTILAGINIEYARKCFLVSLLYASGSNVDDMNNMTVNELLAKVIGE